MADNPLIDKAISDAQNGRKTGDTQTASKNIYNDVLAIQQQDGGPNSAQFKTDLTTLNAKLHADGNLPNLTITGIDQPSQSLTVSDGTPGSKPQVESSTSFANDWYPGLPTGTCPTENATEANNAVKSIEALDTSKLQGKQLTSAVDTILKQNGMTGNDDASKQVIARLEQDGKLAPLLQAEYGNDGTINKSDIQNSIAKDKDPANQLMANALLTRFDVIGNILSYDTDKTASTLNGTDLKVYAGIQTGNQNDDDFDNQIDYRNISNITLAQLSDKNSNVTTLKDFADGKSVSVGQINSDLNRKDLTPDQKAALTEIKNQEWSAWLSAGNDGGKQPPDSFQVSAASITHIEELDGGTSSSIAQFDSKYLAENQQTEATPGSPQSDTPATTTLPDGGSKTITKGEVTRIANPDGSGNSFEYDANGNLTGITQFTKNGNGASYELNSDGKWVASHTGAPAPFTNPNVNLDGSFSYTDATGHPTAVGADGTVSKTIQNGDSLYSIIERNYPNMTPEQQGQVLTQIISLNQKSYPGLQNNPDLIEPGQQITLPSDGLSGL